MKSRKLATIHKATVSEKENYTIIEKWRCGPLYGYADMQGIPVPIEYLGEGEGQPNYEAIAPTGFYFNADETHTLMGFTLLDMLERLACNRLVSCTEHRCDS